MLHRFCLCALLWPAMLAAQDNNYWTHQYGSRAALLGGAVVADTTDNSATYYNPAALAHIRNPALSINANAYHIDMISLPDRTGAGLDLSSQPQIYILPMMVAGVRVLGQRRQHVLGYCLLTRHHARARIDSRREAQLDALTNVPGNEFFSGQFQFASTQTEIWAGVGYGLRLSPKFSVGVTQFVTFRNQQRNFTQVATAVSATDFAYHREYNYLLLNHFGIIYKVGALWATQRLSLGVTLTAPRINLGGSSNTGRDLIRTGFATSNPGVQFENTLGQDFQKSRPTAHRHPLSIALGWQYATRKGIRLAGVVEWFEPIGYYTVVQPENAPFFKAGGTVFSNVPNTAWLSTQQGNASVINWAMGIELPLKPNWHLLTSFRTDYNARVLADPQGISEVISRGNWDLYHTTAGLRITRSKSELNLGLKYSFGGSNNFPLRNFADPADANFLFGSPQIFEVTATSLALLLGYTYIIK